MRKLIILILALTMLAVSAASALGGDDPDQPLVDEILATLLPKAEGNLSGDGVYAGARRLTVRLNEAVEPLGPDATSAQVSRQAHLAWVSELASGAAIARSPRRISSFAVVDSTGRTLPDGAGFGATLRVARDADPWAIYPKLGELAPEAASEQMASNLSVLRAGVEDGVLRSADAAILPVGKERSMYAVGVELTVSSMDAFAPYLGDAIHGLGTGLVGGADTAIEGFAVRIRDEQGVEAGGWYSTRTGDGSLVGTPCELRITLPFTSRTGGAEKPVGSGGSCGG